MPAFGWQGARRRETGPVFWFVCWRESSPTHNASRAAGGRRTGPLAQPLGCTRAPCPPGASAGRATAGRYSYGDLSVTVSNGSPYCLWRAGEYSFSSSPEGPVVTLYQGATSLGRADPEYSYQVTNAEDRYGFSKGCFIPPGTSRSFDVNEPSASSPGNRKRAEADCVAPPELRVHDPDWR